ncbi:Anaerobic glycerol-3-phosphate dehydrogenase subunit C [Enhygromyxa salina]|uniref:Anaerobic glycerol-3-phosphate dehydrogenase subunit C n=1 Tax=Enhygromyxa salina TaxID=215803 RepID=A0A2S9YGD7_9BACT|nr:heterodisulfide reductase-related iron-sulfur binding cluster [Enhygromyxa salina]PRQ04175.1 Anaerobic glycerol-3-phosphate dehydrogenase subunit C [Enhygromyxa salina]
MADTPQNISYEPTDGLTYDPNDHLYWSEAALAKEVTRVFEVCHGCRMCFKYCDSFPNLFDLIDNKYDGDVTRLSRQDKDAVMDACFQCKLCEVQCPYTPRDGHKFQLDFPKLVHRYQAQRAADHGPSLRDLALRDPDRTGALARASVGLANKMNRVGIHRWFMEKVVGIHRDKQLPDFALETFDRWATKTGRAGQLPGGEVVLFQTCYVQNNEPQIGRDTVEVFERNGVDIRCRRDFQCCGMPAWEGGDLAGVRAKIHHNVALLEPYVDAGAKVVAINPTCSMMLRREWPELVEREHKERVQKVADAVRDPGEFLWGLRKQARFNTEFASKPEAEGFAYHVPCHLRAQSVGFKGRDLIRKLLDVKPATVMECCGHDGTSAMKVESFEYSIRVGKKAFDQMKEAKTELWATDCPLAAIQFEQHAGVSPMHPMSILARAYRGDSFDPKAAPKPDDGKRHLPILSPEPAKDDA